MFLQGSFLDLLDLGKRGRCGQRNHLYPAVNVYILVGFFFVSLYLLPIQMPMLFIYFSSTFIGCFFFFPLCIQMAVCFCNVLLGFRDPRAWLTKGCRKAEVANVLRFGLCFLYFWDILECIRILHGKLTIQEFLCRLNSVPQKMTIKTEI